jgi:hypothetical protein
MFYPLLCLVMLASTQEHYVIPIVCLIMLASTQDVISVRARMGRAPAGLC